MLQLNHITKCFADGQRNLTVLDDLSLQIAKGEFIAITGESGAGKTTLLSILATILTADRGDYIINGRRTADLDLSILRNQEIGVVYQDYRLLPQFTVLQNILLPTLAAQGASSTQQVQRARQLMEFTGITSLENSKVGTLSGGEKTRVAICRALINQPSVLLADEPTGQLDAANAQTIAQLFQKINSELHTTIVMVTHSQQMARMAQKNYRLINGRLELLS